MLPTSSRCSGKVSPRHGLGGPRDWRPARDWFHALLGAPGADSGSCRLTTECSRLGSGQGDGARRRTRGRDGCGATRWRSRIETEGLVANWHCGSRAGTGKQEWMRIWFCDMLFVCLCNPNVPTWPASDPGPHHASRSIPARAPPESLNLRLVCPPGASRHNNSAGC